MQLLIFQLHLVFRRLATVSIISITLIRKRSRQKRVLIEMIEWKSKCNKSNLTYEQQNNAIHYHPLVGPAPRPGVFRILFPRQYE